MRFKLVLVAAMLLVVEGCSKNPATPEYWSQAFSDAKNRKERLKLVDEMRTQSRVEGPFSGVLLKQLEVEKSADVKASIARALAASKSEAATDALVKAIVPTPNDADERTLNKEIVQAIRALGDKKATPELVKLVSAKDGFTAIAAIETLGEWKVNSAAPVIIELAANEATEPFIVKKCVVALGQMASKESVPTLVKLMFKERKGVSFYLESSFSLFQIGTPAADALLPILKQEDKATFEWAGKNNIVAPALLAKSAQVLGDLKDARAEKEMIKLLKYENEMLDFKLFVRMRMADALGRMKSKAAIPALVANLNELESNARGEYIRALTKIGGRESVAALQKSASIGSWDGREPSMIGISMLGDEKDIALIDAFVKAEEKLTKAECAENPDYKGCTAPDALVKAHVDAIQKLAPRLAAAKECKTNASCWEGKLKDTDSGVRERAAYEIGRSAQGNLSALMAQLQEPNLDARVAIIQATDWLVSQNGANRATAKKQAPAIAKQLQDERGKTEFVKVNEDLRRLQVEILRDSSTS